MSRNVLTKGWRFHAHAGTFQSALRFEEFQLKKSVGDVVLRLQCAPVTGFDLDQVRGLQGKVPLPAVGGLSGVGVVTEGSGIFKEGDRAVLLGANGAWSQYAVSSANHLLSVPATIPVEYASLLASGPFAAYRILKAAHLKAGDLVLVNGAHTAIGLAALQIAKAWGIDAVGVAHGAPALQVEKLKQMGLNVVSSFALDPKQVFGTSQPKFAISLVGGNAAAYVTHLIGSDGHIITCPLASDEPHILPNVDLVNKNLTIQTFSPWKSLLSATATENEQMVSELCDLIAAHKLKANAVVRHEFGNLLDAIREAEHGTHNAVILHEGTEKTWDNKNHDIYMEIDDKLQANWDAAAAAQDPYLKAGRDQPWQVLAEAEEVALPDELRVKLAAVTTEAELLAVLDTLTLKERHLLGLPATQAITVSAEELKKMVSEFAS
eukprot:EG_transcript_10773